MHTLAEVDDGEAFRDTMDAMAVIGLDEDVSTCWLPLGTLVTSIIELGACFASMALASDVLRLLLSCAGWRQNAGNLDGRHNYRSACEKGVQPATPGRSLAL